MNKMRKSFFILFRRLIHNPNDDCLHKQTFSLFVNATRAFDLQEKYKYHSVYFLGTEFL